MSNSEELSGKIANYLAAVFESVAVQMQEGFEDKGSGHLLGCYGDQQIQWDSDVEMPEGDVMVAIAALMDKFNENNDCAGPAGLLTVPVKEFYDADVATQAIAKFMDAARGTVTENPEEELFLRLPVERELPICPDGARISVVWQPRILYIYP